MGCAAGKKVRLPGITRGPVTWPVYDSSDRTLLFNLQNSVGTGVHRDACRFWEDLPYLRPPY